jgi:hypothetical protein
MKIRSPPSPFPSSSPSPTWSAPIYPTRVLGGLQGLPTPLSFPQGTRGLHFPPAFLRINYNFGLARLVLTACKPLRDKGLRTYGFGQKCAVLERQKSLT